METDKRRIIIAVLVVFAGLCIFAIKSFMSKKNGIIVQKTETGESTGPLYSEEETDCADQVLPVYICGAVINPGIYEVSVPVYLYELIEMAGGLSEEACPEQLDLVYVIDSSQSIYIPFVNEDEKGTHLFHGKDLLFHQDDNGGENNGKININEADMGELMELPGIGEKTAQSIISYREEHGFFQSVDEIKNVSGIGEAKYAQICDLICV